jgi:hypothetical protein
MHHRPARRRGLAALTLVSAVLLGAAACSDDDGNRADVETLTTDADVTTTTEATEHTEPPETTTSVTTAPTTAAVEITAAATSVVEQHTTPTEPLAVVRGQQPWKQLRLIDLRRDGNHVTLDFEIVTGEGEPDPTFAFSAGDAATAYDVSGVTLIDHKNRKRYLVLQDDEDNCLCTAFDHLDEIQENTAYIHSAQFPAPPAGVKVMSVDVPKFSIVDRVPVRDVGE